MSNFTYKAFDFTIDSALELPGFPSTTGESDVLITEGTVPHQLKRPSACGLFFQAQSTEWLLTLERIAGVRFHIRDGREIVVERMPG
ncbi:MAG: hypothetical protein H3C34_26630, partial [Caldilineaceae bacterium]|nr:hypothetical protein [Caldilineaceae bacterium]